MDRTIFFLFCFFVFLFCLFTGQYLRKAGPWGGPISRTDRGIFAHTFSTLQQNRFWASFTRVSLHARVQNASQKIVFFLERGPGGESLPAAWALEIDGF